MSLHPVAAGGFASAAPTYARIRPTYARSAVGDLKEALGVSRVVADVGAGTGILTGQLHRARVTMVAVEPVPEMLDQLRRSLPAVPSLRGLAEALPFVDAALGGVVVGEAFHWFDAAAAVREASRVLCPGGVLAMLWNRRDSAVDWVRRYDEAVLSERPEGRPYAHDADWDEVVGATTVFGPAQRSDHPNSQPASPSGLVDRAASTSFVAAADPVARDRILNRVRELTATHPALAGREQFDLPYRTEVRLWRRNG